VDGFLLAFAVSFGLIFVAELGDKSQLLALTFATRYRALPVLIGITIATAVVHALSVVIGHGFGAVLPTGWITLGAAVAFVGFGAWTLRGDALTSAESTRAERSTGSAVLATSVAFFLAELGDKTMLATITVATQYGWFGTWLGSTLGMVAADALAILAGRKLGRYLPERVVTVGAAATFVAFGAWLAADAVGQLSGRPTWDVVADVVDHHVAGWIAFALVAVVVALATRWPRRSVGVARRPRSRGLAVAAVVAGLTVPVLVGTDVLQPARHFDHTALFLAGAALAVVGAGIVALTRAGVPLPVLRPRRTGVLLATAGLVLMVPTPVALVAAGLGVAAASARTRTSVPV